ncbi:hypothetical protein [Streptomyces himalayensis]|uniref:Uncharacterized protein n=1 Tax=Streptomyces himalayensis subsp. himalayensis TaxID=2756131 RepID=A0A7W0DPM7_9ACTN|nr:hypothetical protein [Streptomyces himalayensis]MBA2948901.1 hypothetical protein [Streptomyces himalayensis subsp. himalayensis]
MAVVSAVAASGLEYGVVGGFPDAFTVCAVAAAVGAVVALALVARGKPQLTVGPHVHSGPWCCCSRA